MHPDDLRDPSSIAVPDPRNDLRVVLEPNGMRSRTLHDHHVEVASIVLHDNVPAGVRKQFETAKNLYLYGWFVYRFFPVARSHAYACLELALRERFEPEMLKQAKKRTFGPGLKGLLEHAVDTGALRPDGFDVIRHKAHARALERASIEAIEGLQRTDTDELEIGNAEIQPRGEDWDTEFVNSLPESMSFVRNHYAHSSTSLDDRVLSVLRFVSEIINQIFQSDTHAGER